MLLKLKDRWRYCKTTCFSLLKTKTWYKRHLSAKVALEWLNNKKINVLQWPTQNPNLSAIKNLWHCLKIAVHKRQTNKPEQPGENLSERTGTIPPKPRANLAETSPNRLKAATAEKSSQSLFIL